MFSLASSPSQDRWCLFPIRQSQLTWGNTCRASKNQVIWSGLWIDYVTELAREAETHPDRDATVVAIGIHPFVIGTPNGTAALRRVLENFKNQKLVWVTDVEAVLDAAGEKQ